MRPLNWIQWSTLVLLFVVPALTVVMFLRVQDVQRHQNDALHNIICFVAAAEQRNPHLSVVRKRQALTFWRRALTDAHLKPCQGD